MEPSVQDALQALIVPLVRTLGPNNSTLLDLLREFKPEAESLALRILSIWTENARPTPGIISVVKDLLAEKELDPKFLIIIIGEMDKVSDRQHLTEVPELTSCSSQADIVKNLPKIISTLSGKAEDRDQVRKVFSNVVTDIPVGVSTNMPRVRQSERLAPSELMVLLHEQEKEIGLKATIEGNVEAFFECDRALDACPFSHWHLLRYVGCVYFRNSSCCHAAACGRSNIASPLHANGEFQQFGIREIELLSGGL